MLVTSVNICTFSQLEGGGGLEGGFYISQFLHPPGGANIHRMDLGEKKIVLLLVNFFKV